MKREIGKEQGEEEKKEKGKGGRGGRRVRREVATGGYHSYVINKNMLTKRTVSHSSMYNISIRSGKLKGKPVGPYFNRQIRFIPTKECEILHMICMIYFL